MKDHTDCCPEPDGATRVVTEVPGDDRCAHEVMMGYQGYCPWCGDEGDFVDEEGGI